MKEQIKGRARLLRVRGTQHRIAQADAARAQHDVERVLFNRQRVEQLRSDVQVRPTMTTGAHLATVAEFAMRLDGVSAILKASEQRTLAIAELRRDACIQAQINEEGVRRLHRSAVDSWEALAGKRLAQSTRRRRRDNFNGDDV